MSRQRPPSQGWVGALIQQASRLTLMSVMVSTMTGCGGEVTRPRSIPVRAEVDGQPISCHQPAEVAGQALELLTFKLYVHGLVGIDGQGGEHPLTLIEDGHFQSGGVAQLDFDDGLEGCRNSSAATHTSLEVLAPEVELTALTLTVGVPFELNHINPAKAPPPLSDTSMHWSWQGGFKFLRVDARAPGGPVKLHLGSTGCEGTVGAITRCARPNRPVLTLPLGKEGVTLDVGAWLAPLVGAGAALSCMSGAEEPGCAGLFPRLGLELSTGDAAAGRRGEGA